MLHMVILGAVVITLGILIYLSATRSPIQQENGEQESAPAETINDIEDIFGFNDQTQGEGDPDSENSEEDENVVATITLEDAITPEKEILQARGDTVVTESNERIYTLRLRSSWSKQLHPNWHPDGSHLSPMVAWSHGLEDVLFRSGSIASDGMEIMAETGATGTLTEEIKNLTALGSIFSHGVGTVFHTPGENEIRIKVSRNMPYVTVVSMIAPSPDWFITARNIKLYENGRWLEQKSVPAVLYDAGTDSGTDFTAPDKDTKPKQPISRLRSTPSIPIASFEFIEN